MRTGLRSQNTGQGFTLLEVLLAMVLLMLLLGAIVFNFTSLQRGAALEEGSTQFEALLRYAQAHAAESGRKVQLVFEEEVAEDLTLPLGKARIKWEPDPMSQPGVFVDLASAAELVRGLEQLVQVESVRQFEPGESPAGESATTTSTNNAATAISDEGSSEYQPPITFYPDGSSDSAEIRLASRDSEDPRRVTVRLTGITGTIQRQRVAEESEPTDTTGEKRESEKSVTTREPVVSRPAEPPAVTPSDAGTK